MDDNIFGGNPLPPMNLPDPGAPARRKEQPRTERVASVLLIWSFLLAFSWIMLMVCVAAFRWAIG